MDALSTLAGLIVNAQTIRVSEPRADDLPSAVHVTSLGLQVPTEWRRTTAPGWIVSEFTKTWDEPAEHGGMLLLPVGVPVTVEVIGPGGLAIDSIEWMGPLDVNLDGFIGPEDYLQFLTWFEVGDPRADFNADGWLDPSDYTDFLSAWESP